MTTAVPPLGADASTETDAFTAVIGRGDQQRVGPYRLLRSLGRGGMGAVFLAEPLEACAVPTGKQVALKILRKVTDEERKRFEREARYLQSLTHPGIVRVYDHAEHQGYPYLVMELVDGPRLDQLIEEGQRLDERRCVVIAISALEALHVAHLAGILHRDIKPNNIMVAADGSVRLLDFGLAQQLEGESRLTRTGSVVGTPAYMSPEQACGEDLNVRSDVYSMGACLYELLTGFQPFSADNPMAVLRRIIDEPLLPPSRLRKQLGRALETIVLKAMAKLPGDRYASAEAMADDLRRYRDGRPIRARRLSRLLVAKRWAWAHRRILTALALAAFVVGTAGGLALRRVLRERAPSAPPDMGNDWIGEWRQDAALDGQRNTLSNHDPLGSGMTLAQLPPVIGPVRLSVAVAALGGDGQVELLVSDRDLGRGYRLVLQRRADGDKLILMREDTVVLSRELTAPLAAGRAHRLTLEREEAALSATLDDEPPLRFRDLTPIEGAEAASVYVGFTAASMTVSDVRLERRRNGVLSGPLAAADTLRQNGRYASALRLYETFLRDQPASAEARDARLRQALCVEALGDNGRALELFQAVVHENAGRPDYVALGIFHAWSCCLSLGRYEQAEAYFAAIRRDYDLDTLLRAVPQAVLAKLVFDYLARADGLAISEPVRAVELYDRAADLGGFLKLPDAISQAKTGAGDTLVGRGDFPAARTRFDAVASDQRLPIALRLKASLKLAEVERLAERADAADRIYREVIANTPDEQQAQWGRLWLGDLLLEQGDVLAAAGIWSGASEALSPPGRIMQALLDPALPLPDSDDRYFTNDCLYFAARRALLAHQQERYLDGLESVVRVGPANDWPTPLAKLLLAERRRD